VYEYNYAVATAFPPIQINATQAFTTHPPYLALILVASVAPISGPRIARSTNPYMRVLILASWREEPRERLRRRGSRRL
jgi:hypothetical protein